MSRPAARPAQLRNNALAQIHMAKAQLAMDDDTYRAMLWAQARVRSAKDLDHAGRAKVLAHLQACGAKLGHPGAPKNVPQDRAAQMAKIEALLADAGRPWAYVQGMCERICKVSRIEFATPDHLQKLIAALMYDAKRRKAALATQQAKDPS